MSQPARPRVSGKRLPDRHDYPPIVVRLPDADVRWWLGIAKARGLPVSTPREEQAALRKMVRELIERGKAEIEAGEQQRLKLSNKPTNWW
jgi:hypothetical protein